MKQFMLLASATLLFCQFASAAPCVAGSLASYVALGTTGCTIGTNTLFGFQTLSGTSGATEISAAGVAIAPLGGSFNPGISATVNLTAGAGTLLETIFTYRITGNTYKSDTITLSNSSETVDGAVTDTQNFCGGGTFGVSGVTGCTGSPGSLLTLDGIQNQDSKLLNAVSLLSITDDFTLDGGIAGSASGGRITDQLTAVPEPSGLLLAGLGFTLALVTKSFRK